jgi:hypothetical protein
VFDQYLRDRDPDGRRWRRRLGFWLLVAAGPFSLFVAPLLGPYLFLVGWVLAGRFELPRRLVLGSGDVPTVLVVGYAVLGLVLAAVMILGIPPEGSSDNAWLIMLVPAYWLGITAPMFVASAVLPRTSWRERALAASMLAFTALGILTAGSLALTVATGPERDLLGYSFRPPILLALAISVAMLIVVPISVRLSAARASF